MISHGNLKPTTQCTLEGRESASGHSFSHSSAGGKPLYCSDVCTWSFPEQKRTSRLPFADIKPLHNRAVEINHKRWIDGAARLGPTSTPVSISYIAKINDIKGVCPSDGVDGMWTQFGDLGYKVPG